MRPTGTTPKKRLSDDGPIVFPVPTTGPYRPEKYPDDFPPDSDLLIDPYGSVYCFVCQVQVPRGPNNILQHVEGKKHDLHNKRFSNPFSKSVIRNRYRTAATSQRETLPPAPAKKTPPTIAELSKANGAKDESCLEEALKNKDCPRKLARKELVKRYNNTTIDKEAFLKELVQSDSDSNGSDVEGEELEEDEVEMDITERQKPFKPLSLGSTGLADLFDTMPEETERTGKLANIVDIASKARQENEAVPKMQSEDEKDEDGIEFIPIDAKSPGEVAQEEEEKRMKEKIQKEIGVIRDVNGEELPPWLLEKEEADSVLYSSDSSVAMHYEILQFAQFVSPTQEELSAREDMVTTVRSIVKSLWPESKTEVFGSYATDLYLPTSDIDMCVLDSPNAGGMSEIELLAEAVRNVTGFAKQVLVIKAQVPLVKIVSKMTGISCDICIGNDNGPKVVPIIKEYLEEFPALRPLFLVIKSFLKQRDLNEVFTGGLGSYTIFLLVVSHLQMLPHNFPRSKANLGFTLQSFFQLYGRLFNFCVAGVQVRDGGSYVDKFEKYKTLPKDTLRYSVEDPNDVTNELGKNGYASVRVRKAFSNASMTLIKWRRDDAADSPTPLGSIMNYDDEMRLRRGDVVRDMLRKGKEPIAATVSDPDAPKTVESVDESGKSEDEVQIVKVTMAAPHITPPANSPTEVQGATDKHKLTGRARDPRLAKRRRINQYQPTTMQAQSSTNSANYSHGDGPNGTPSGNQSVPHSVEEFNVNGPGDADQGQFTDGQYGFDPQEGSYPNQPQPNFAQPKDYVFPPQPQEFPPIPPGFPGQPQRFQYVEESSAFPMNGDAPDAMYQANGYGPFPQRTVPQMQNGGTGNYNNPMRNNVGSPSVPPGHPGYGHQGFGGPPGFGGH